MLEVDRMEVPVVVDHPVAWLPVTMARHAERVRQIVEYRKLVFDERDVVVVEDVRIGAFDPFGEPLVLHLGEATQADCRFRSVEPSEQNPRLAMRVERVETRPHGETGRLELRHDEHLVDGIRDDQLGRSTSKRRNPTLVRGVLGGELGCLSMSLANYALARRGLQLDYERFAVRPRQFAHRDARAERPSSNFRDLMKLRRHAVSVVDTGRKRV
jgi:hypothetical protein